MFQEGEGVTWQAVPCSSLLHQGTVLALSPQDLTTTLRSSLLGAEQPGMQSPGSKAPKHRDTGFQEASEDPLQRQMGTYSLLRVLVICKMSTSGFWCQLQICGMQLVSGYVSLRIAKWQKPTLPLQHFTLAPGCPH